MIDFKRVRFVLLHYLGSMLLVDFCKKSRKEELRQVGPLLKNASVFETQGNRIQGQKSFKRPCAPIESVRKLDFGRKRSDDIEVVPAGATH